MINEKLKDLSILRTFTEQDVIGFYNLSVEAYQTTSGNKKKAILGEQLELVGPDKFKAVMRLVYNSFYTWGVTVKAIEKLVTLGNYPELDNIDITYFQEAIDIITSNVENKITNSYMITSIPWDNLTEPEEDLILSIFSRDLGMGVKPSTINKVLLGAVPVFNITRATDLKDVQLEGEYVIELKLDGTRDFLIVPPNSDGRDFYVLSRNGRRLDIPEAYEDLRRNMGHITNFSKGFVLDCELTLKGSEKSEDRTAITGIHNSAIAKVAGKNSTLDEDWSKHVSLNVFDIIPYENFFNSSYGVPHIERRLRLTNMFINGDYNCIQVTGINNVILPRDMSTVTANFDAVIKSGGEGLILKEVNSTYSFDKRNSGWYKLKKVLTCELIVKGYQMSEDTNLPKGMGSLICESSCSSMSVKVGTGFNLEDRGYKSIKDGFNVSYKELEGYRLDDWVGKIIEVEYFGVSYSDSSELPSLYLPRYLRVREDKLEADTLEYLESIN